MEEEVFNENPSFIVWLVDITKYQNSIAHTRVGDYVRFRINSEKNVEAYTMRSGGIGTVSKKDAALFPLIYTKPIYFEAIVISIANSSKNSYKVKVKIQVKKESCYKLYHKQWKWKYPVKRWEAEAPKGRLDPDPAAS